MDYISIIRKYLRQTATIYLHSNPNFIMEAFLAFITFLLYVYQHIDIYGLSKRMLYIKPNTIYYNTVSGNLCKLTLLFNFKTSINYLGSNSKDSLCTSITNFQHQVNTTNPSTTIAYKRALTTDSSKSQMGWILQTQPTNRSMVLERKRLADQILSLTPDQYVKLDKKRRKKEKEFENHSASLATLCRNVTRQKYSSSTLSRQIEMVRENLECNSKSLEGKYLGHKADIMTRSLLCILEHIITNSSLENPLPFKGDITTLALDAAELSQINHNNKNFETVADDKFNGEDGGYYKDKNWEKSEIKEIYCD